MGTELLSTTVTALFACRVTPLNVYEVATVTGVSELTCPAIKKPPEEIVVTEEFSLQLFGLIVCVDPSLKMASA
jgi:hypothetical protein